MNSVVIEERAVIPSKIVCIGRNYVEHLEELGNELADEMVVFFKPNSAIARELNAIHVEPLSYEGELCFVYENGRFSAVGFGLDLTKRELQSRLKQKSLPWERAKAFDGAATFGRFVKLEHETDTLSMTLEINGSVVQTGSSELMLYKPDDILMGLAEFVTLNDGDIVMTGTPKGVGIVHAGDEFRGCVYAGGELISTASWRAK